MKNLKNLMVFTFSAFWFVGKAQFINFTDVKFKDALVNTMCVDNNMDGNNESDADFNNNGEIEVSEALNVKVFYFSSLSMSVFSEFQYFENLERLQFLRPQFKEFSLPSLPKLTYLTIFLSDVLTKVDIIDQPNLIFFHCYDNSNLRSINLNNLPKLSNVSADQNILDTIILKKLPLLGYINIFENNLRNIDLEECPGLLSLNANYNKLEKIDFKFNSTLSGIKLNYNNLKEINLTNNKQIYSIEAINNKIEKILFDSIPLLNRLQIDDNNLNSLKLNNPVSLFSVSANNNFLKTIELKNAPKLKQLRLENNMLDSINLIDCPALELLYCKSNKLVTINLNNNKSLKFLNLESNQLKFFKLTNNDNILSIPLNDNLLDTLEISNLPLLTDISCQNNKISQLKLDNLPSLKSLKCSNNLISKIEIEKFPSVETLDCYKNNIKSLDLSNSKLMTFLYCEKNNIDSLDLSKCNNIFYAICSDNLIQKINLGTISKLNNLTCDNNLLTSLNINDNKNIDILKCSNNLLEYLFIKNKSNHLALDFSQNKNLKYICCTENSVNSISSKITSYGLNNCVLNSYCNFEPGALPNYLNVENRYTQNLADCPQSQAYRSNVKYNITNGTSTNIYFSKSDGKAVIPLFNGTYTIKTSLENTNAFSISPSVQQVFIQGNSSITHKIFCVTPKGINRQINITIIPLSPSVRPGFEAQYKIVWENAGNQIESGTLNFTYDESRLDYVEASQVADIVNDGIVKWNFSDLQPFEKREIIVTLKVNRPTDTPAVNAGDKLYLTASILDNIFTLENTVVGSYDPNDKTCLQGDRIHPDQIGKYVDFLIRFENTGNYAAENIVVKDIIDTKTFDVSSLQITDASHEVYARIEGNKVEFIFEKIQLPFDDANNDGYIAFKIKTLPTLLVGDSLKNLADIYFDYNFPIRTNETKSKLAFPVGTKDLATEVKVYPNPVSDILSLEIQDDIIQKIEIFDLQGRIIRSSYIINNQLNVSDLKQGSYLSKVYGQTGIGWVRFVKI